MIRLLIATIAVVFMIGILSPAVIHAGGDKNDDASYIKLKAKGKLITGIVAIGGETTGTILKTKDGTLELNLGKEKKLRDLASKLNKQNVVVEGRLQIKRGTEIRQRLIVAVTGLKAAGD